MSFSFTPMLTFYEDDMFNHTFKNQKRFLFRSIQDIKKPTLKISCDSPFKHSLHCLDCPRSIKEVRWPTAKSHKQYGNRDIPQSHVLTVHIVNQGNQQWNQFVEIITRQASPEQIREPHGRKSSNILYEYMYQLAVYT
jgi:hypothetical protein